MGVATGRSRPIGEHRCSDEHAALPGGRPARRAVSGSGGARQTSATARARARRKLLHVSIKAGSNWHRRITERQQLRRRWRFGLTSFT